MNSQVFVLAFALAMDAFAVAVCNGLCNQQVPLARRSLATGLTFGVFQGLMPLLGYLVGGLFKNFVVKIDHWIALILLGALGLKMLYDGYQSSRSPQDVDCSVFGLKTLLLQGVATSIDALAIGISFALVGTNIVVTSLVIALVTFVLSCLGVLIGEKFGHILDAKAQYVGGFLLIFLGIRIFYEHVFVI